MNYLKYKLNILKDERSKKLIFLPDNRNHYVYRISNLITNKHYYGSRVTKLNPYEDLGIKYFSSSSVKEFLTEQKQNPENFKYKVIKVFDNPGDNILYESFLHEYFSVSKNNRFINLSSQLPFGWTTTGNNLISLKAAETMSKIDPDTGISIRELANIKGKITNSIIDPLTGNSKAVDTAKKSVITKSIKDPITGYSINDIVGLKKRGINHHKFKGYYMYNELSFESTYEMSKYFNHIIPPTSLTRRFENLDLKISNIAYSMSKFLQTLGSRSYVVGKSFKNLGFYFKVIDF